MLSRFGVAALVALLFATSLTSANAQTQDDVDDARDRQSQVRSDAEDAAEDIDVLEAEVDQLLAVIEALQVNVDLTAAQLANAEQNLRASEFGLADVRQRIDVLESQREATESSLRTTAIEQYVDGDTFASTAFLSADEPLTATVRQRLYDVAGGTVSETLESLRALDEQLAVERQVSEELVAQAEVDREAIAPLAEQAEEALTLQESIVEQVQSRLSSRLAEAEALAAVDAELSSEIRRGEQAIAAEAARIQAIRDAAVTTPPPASGGGSGGDAGGDTGTTTDPPSVEGRGDRVVPTPPLTTVRGITVNSSIAGRLESLLAAASADGINLGGGGYRNSEAQIRLRIAHCGNTEYLIWDAPASSCSPPTARPGESNHEKGLAVDFTHNGSAIRSRSSDAFQWLASNAGGYGFINLPSEPWHWSVNGN